MPGFWIGRRRAVATLRANTNCDQSYSELVQALENAAAPDERQRIAKQIAKCFYPRASRDPARALCGTKGCDLRRVQRDGQVHLGDDETLDAPPQFGDADELSKTALYLNRMHSRYGSAQHYETAGGEANENRAAAFRLLVADNARIAMSHLCKRALQLQPQLAAFQAEARNALSLQHIEFLLSYVRNAPDAPPAGRELLWSDDGDYIDAVNELYMNSALSNIQTREQTAATAAQNDAIAELYENCTGGPGGEDQDQDEDDDADMGIDADPFELEFIDVNQFVEEPPELPPLLPPDAPADAPADELGLELELQRLYDEAGGLLG